MRRLLLIALTTAALLGGCAPVPPAPGTAVAELQSPWGRPTARYAKPDGGSRLEFATGPYGRTTWMIDIDAGGRVTASRQMLTEAEFLQVQTAGALSRDELLRWLGTPGERKHGGALSRGELWSWRYPTNDCLWFQVSLSDAGVVTGSGYGIDPRCDAPSERAK
jgi:hypothetical protein